MTKKYYFSALALAVLISNSVFAAEAPNASAPTAAISATPPAAAVVTPPPAPTTPISTTATLPATPVSTVSELDKISYSLGIQMGGDLKQQEIEINTNLYMQGLSDAQKSGPNLLTEEEVKNTLINFQKKLIQKQQENQLKLSAKNLEEGTKFLEENKKKPGVVTLPSGLQYRVLQEGIGAKPIATDTVTTQYSGKFIDGKEFDSSYSRGEPAQFQVNAVIPAWTEALQLMAPGAKWEIAVPAKLGYGENGIGRIIGPNATLLFNIELVSINNKENAAPEFKKTPPKTNTTTKSPSSSTQKSASQRNLNKS